MQPKTIHIKGSSEVIYVHIFVLFYMTSSPMEYLIAFEGKE